MSPLILQLRTPGGLLVDRPIFALTAEDLDGWFGVRPGRADLVAVLPPGLLAFRDEEGEAFVALAGGLLHVRGGACRVLAREAILSRDLDGVADALDAHLSRRRRQHELQQDAVGDLAREALRRLVAEAR
jgi:F-type H+-transporting ATPase subunit epsilon